VPAYNYIHDVMPKQLTIRGVSDELGQRLDALARAKGQSVNTTVLRILEGAAGVNERRQRLERYATWTERDVEEFEGALRAQRAVDEHLWR